MGCPPARAAGVPLEGATLAPGSSQALRPGFLLVFRWARPAGEVGGTTSGAPGTRRILSARL